MLEAWRSWSPILANDKNKSNTELIDSARSEGGQATRKAFTSNIFLTGLPRVLHILVEDLLCSVLLIFLGNSFRDSPRPWSLSLFQIQAIKINNTLNTIANIETCMSSYISKHFKHFYLSSKIFFIDLSLQVIDLSLQVPGADCGTKYIKGKVHLYWGAYSVDKDGGSSFHCIVGNNQLFCLE